MASTTFQNSADQVARSLGLSGEHGEELAEQSTRNLEAIAECSTILMNGFQEISREWISFAQQRWQRNVDAMQTLASCKSVQDVVTAQTELVRANVEEIVQSGRKIAETSAQVANEAAATLTSPTKSGSSRLRRAA